MIRNLALVAMMVLALAGTAFAQTNPDSTDQPSTANTQPGTTTPTAEGDPANPTSPPPADTTGTAPAEPASAAPDATAQPPAAPAGQAVLPATASSAPLTFAIGVAAIAGFFTLLIYRRRTTTKS